MTVTINQLSHTVNRYATMYHLHTELEELSEKNVSYHIHRQKHAIQI